MGEALVLESTSDDISGFGYPVAREDGVYFPGEWYTEELNGTPSGAMLFHIDPVG